MTEDHDDDNDDGLDDGPDDDTGATAARPAGGAGRHAYEVAADHDGVRLDRVLAELSELSRSRLKALIEAGEVAVAGVVVTDPSRKVRDGERIVLEVPPPAPAEPEPQDIALAVVYEDDDLVVVDKPAGLVVHPAPGNPDRTLVNALLHHCRGGLSGVGGVARPGIVHRLDKDTSGLLVAAKTDRAHQGLARLFHDHDLERGYMAVVWGRPGLPSGTVDTAIGRSPANRKKMAVVRSGGRRAVTHWRLERAVGSKASLIDCRLETGRTHQIRVHLAHIGHPVVGDPLYGGRVNNRLDSAPPEVRDRIAAYPGQALHAYLLGFVHPVSGEKLRFQSDLPPKIKALLSNLEKL